MGREKRNRDVSGRKGVLTGSQWENGTCMC